MMTSRDPSADAAGGPARLALVALAVALVAPGGPRLAASWLPHGPAVPLAAIVAAFGLAACRARRPPPVDAWWPALPAGVWLALALALHLVGARSGAWWIAWLALPPLVLAVSAMTLGRASARWLWPSAAVLVLVVPPPNVVTHFIVIRLKDSVGAAAAWVLAMGGIATELDGWILRIGSREVGLADACGGMRAQAGLIAIAAVVLAARRHSRVARCAVLAASVPAAFVASTLRVASVGAAHSARAGELLPEELLGVYHDASGVLVIVVGVLLLLGVSRAASALAPVSDDADDAALPLARARETVDASHGARWQIGVAGVAIALAIALSLSSPPASSCPCAPRLTLPDRLDGNAGEASDEALPLERWLGADHLAIASYGARRDLAAAAVVHFHRLDAPSDLFVHAVESCHAVGGWTTANARTVSIATVPVQRLELVRGPTRRLVHYVYVDDGLRSPSPSLARAWLRTVARGIAGRATGGTLVILSSGDVVRCDEPLASREQRRMAELLRALGVQGDDGET